ncbi:16S rRNA (cytosine(1407)-C(5))-methyltransferase RsmF [Celerinatantimonas sp. YJH-8]|uniref:16S rRNA (cytosine(1407)-C(5))-methyltransferase RsmF n=1 Tax=Celerinatantimonas sp. YJH-8 TaxID=3228714 RepID=UPI0038CC0385
MPDTLPLDFIELMHRSLPDEQMYESFLAFSDKPLRRSIRVNTLKISTAEFIHRMQPQGWHFTAIPWCPDGFWLERDDDCTALGNTLEHLGGLFYIQEASSMLPVTALFHYLSSRAPYLILDAAAAPGSKTTQIATHLDHLGAIVANEFSASRIKGLFSNLQRCGIGNVALTNYNADVFGKWLPETFDGILLDAPCSGEGTMRKDPKAMDNWSLSHVQDIASLQASLIESVFQALKPGGILIYSTCTLNHLENQDVVASLQELYPDAVELLPLGALFEEANKAETAEGFLHVWPQLYDCEGFFIAALKKTKSVPTPTVAKKVKALPFTPATTKQQQLLKSYLKGQFSLTIDNSSILMVREHEYWLFPEPLLALTGEIRFDRIGLKVAEQFKKEFRLTHEAASHFMPQITKNKVELSLVQAQQYFQGKDIPYPDAQQGAGEVILTCGQILLGLGKQLKGKIKNRLPRDLVRDNIAFK